MIKRVLLLIVALCAVAAGVIALAAPASAAVTVSPQPGTPTASYKTQLSFRGVAPDALGTIRVTGSRSGEHRGEVRAHSDGQGASLVFERDFRRGESVLVQTNLEVTGARADGDYRFKVAGLGNASAIVVAPEPPTKLGRGERDRFQSRRDLSPPSTSLATRSEGIAPGLIFINARNRTARGQQGPMIVDDEGDLVWFRPVGGRNRAMDFRTQEYQGRPVLTWWQGAARQGAGSGEGVIMDSAYKTVGRVRAGNGYRSDLHEFRLTPEGTALITIYNPISRDLSSLGGSSDGMLVDGIVQEIDIATGLVLFEWHSIGNVALADSYSKPVRSSTIQYDYFHINSIAPDADGNLLISARGTWAAYKLDRRTGGTIWQLGGKRSSFKMGEGTRFAWQHDVERRGDGTISLFDNQSAPPVGKRSRALILSVDENARQVELVRAFEHPRGLLAANQGSIQTLPNGNLFVGWGPQRRYSEFTPDGTLVFDGYSSPANDHYRAERRPWSGRPENGPSITAKRRRAQRTAVFASYNGATGVASWEVLAGATPEALAPASTARRTGFETAISVPSAGPYFAVRAKDAEGQVIGTSKTERR